MRDKDFWFLNRINGLKVTEPETSGDDLSAECVSSRNMCWSLRSGIFGVSAGFVSVN